MMLRCAKRLSLSIVLLLMVAGPGSASNNTVKIGIFVSSNSMIGSWQKKGYQLALSQVNSTNTVIEPIYKGSSSNLKVIMESMDLLNSKNVSAVVGGSSSKSSSYIAGVAQRHKIPFVSPFAPMELLSRFGFEYVFRINAPMRWYIDALLNYAAKRNPKPQTMGFVWEDTPFGRRFTVFASDKAKKLGLRVTVNEKVDLADKGRHAADQVIKTKPDVLMLVGNQEDSLRVLKWIKESKYTPKVLLGAGAGFSMSSFVKTQQGAAEGLVTATQWYPKADWLGVSRFVKAFKEKYHKNPNYLSAEAYAAIQVLADALKRTDCSSAMPCRKALKKALIETRTDTVFGPVRFDSFNGYTNQNPHTLLLLQIQNGSLKIVESPVPVTN